MREWIKKVLLISMMCFSFIISGMIANMALNKDELMIKIKEESLKLKVDAIAGKIYKDKIIPGLYGKEVDIKKSYKQMKEYGIYSENLFVFKEIKPQNTLNTNYDKYIISGNSNKKEVSLIFLIYDNDNINTIIDTLNKYNIKANFFIDGYWFEKNKEQLEKVVNNGSIIGVLGYNEKYDDASYIWMDAYIDKVFKQKSKYCYMTKESLENIRICAMNKAYTIKPKIVIKNNYFSNIKKYIDNGLIISLDVNNELIKELPLILQYINSKGYKLDTLDELLKEDI